VRPEERSDGELVERVLAGRREEYSALVERYQAMLYRQALGMVASPDAAADLVQDSFVKGYTSLHSCNDPARFGAWVYRILRNRCLDYLKDHRRRTVPIEERAGVLTSREDPDADLSRSETRRAVTAALAALPEAQREAFLLKHVDGLSYEEMAERLDASVSALKMRVLRAREALQALLTGVEEPGTGT
jgi:RNA polymerase sigma-70 factor (ECF subfamily)